MEQQGAKHLTVNSLQKAQQEANEVHAEIVAAVQALPAAAAEAPAPQQEHPETPNFPIFALVEADNAPKPATQIAAIAHDDPIAPKNSFALSAKDDDDYSDLVEALENFSPNIKVGPEVSQKRRKATKLSPQRIAALAKAIQNKEIDLPDLDLPSDDDYVAVWALMDSGSAVHVVDATKVFHKAKTHPAPKGHQGFKAASGISSLTKALCTPTSVPWMVRTRLCDGTMQKSICLFRQLEN